VRDALYKSSIWTVFLLVSIVAEKISHVELLINMTTLRCIGQH